MEYIIKYKRLMVKEIMDNIDNIRQRKENFIDDLLKKYSNRKDFIRNITKNDNVKKINEIILDGAGNEVENYDIIKSFKLAINNSKEFFRTNGYDINDIKVDNENFAVQFVISKVLDNRYITSSKENPFICCVIAAKGNWKPDNFIGYDFDEYGGKSGVYKTDIINNIEKNIKLDDFKVLHQIFTNFKL